MADYWRGRRLQAFHNTRAARNADERQIYMRIAEQYRSLERWCARSASTRAALTGEPIAQVE
jgi:hypothetical protein